MSKDLNLCQFIGRLGKDPEMRSLPAGDAVCNITVAVGDQCKKKSGEKVETTEWVRAIAFGRLAEIIGEYCRKGSKVYIAGRMVTRKWQDSNGQDKYSTEVKLSELQMLDSRSTTAAPVLPRHDAMQGEASRQQGQHDKPEADNFDDDIPF